MDKRILLPIALLVLMAAFAMAAKPTISWANPTSGMSISKEATLTFNIDDDNTMDKFDANFYYRVHGDGAWTKIIGDGNLANGGTVTCTSYDFTTNPQCSYAWDMTALAAGVYDLNVMVKDYNAVDGGYVSTEADSVWINATRVNDSGVCGLLNVFALIMAAVLLIGGVLAFYTVGRSANLTNDIMGLVIAGCIAIVGIVVFLILYSTFCF